ncbi:MAG: RNA polymerase factor sigma-54 [Candidatus Omnitrophota bacterium]
MRLNQRLVPKQTQKLIMTQQMQQSMHILQLPLLELHPLIEQELTNNPCLEEASETSLIGESPIKKDEFSPPAEGTVQTTSEILENLKQQIKNSNSDDWQERLYTQGSPDDEYFAYKSSLITKGYSLQEDLLKQLRFIVSDPETIKIGETIIGNIDDNGYLKSSSQEMAEVLEKPITAVEKVLKIIKQLEPAGVGAEDLKECLILQLERKNLLDPATRIIIQEHLKDIGLKRYSQIAKRLQLPRAQVQEIAAVISNLDPKPGQNICKDNIQSITPDIILEKNELGYNITINHQNLPHIRTNHVYKQLLKDKNTAEEIKQYLRQKMYNATNLIRSLYQRQHTLTQVVQCIIDFQFDFLEKGVQYLTPMNLKHVAEKLKLHESTISRAVANKYIQTPFGVMPLKDFFSSGIARNDGGQNSVTHIKFEIEKLIKSESAEKPLSDQYIINLLKQKDINIARRTVAKYRRQLKILPAYLRKK